MSASGQLGQAPITKAGEVRWGNAPGFTEDRGSKFQAREIFRVGAGRLNPKDVVSPMGRECVHPPNRHRSDTHKYLGSEYCVCDGASSSI